ncbi:MAG: hypothetical protein AAB305_06430 [Candidatus Zixiibacteriota bacterium]
MATLRKATLAMALLLGTLSTNIFASECATCKGSWKAGGGAYISLRTGEQFGSGEGYSNWGASLSPSIENFISNGLAIGVAGLISQDHKGTNTNYENISNYGFQLSIARYFAIGGGGVTDATSFLYTKLGAGIFAYKRQRKLTIWDEYMGYYDSYKDEKSDVTTFFDGQFGIMPMISRSVGLEIGSRIMFSNLDGYTGIVFQFGAGIAVFAL